MPANLSMVALERGAFRDTYPDGAYPKTIDKLTYLQRFKLFQNLALSSFTFRHGIGDQAVPYRQIGAFRPGTALAARDCTGRVCIGACCRRSCHCAGDGNPFEADRSDQFPLPPQKNP